MTQCIANAISLPNANHNNKKQLTFIRVKHLQTVVKHLLTAKNKKSCSVVNHEQIWPKVNDLTPACMRSDPMHCKRHCPSQCMPQQQKTTHFHHVKHLQTVVKHLLTVQNKKSCSVVNHEQIGSKANDLTPAPMRSDPMHCKHHCPSQCTPQQQKNNSLSSA